MHSHRSCECTLACIVVYGPVERVRARPSRKDIPATWLTQHALAVHTHLHTHTQTRAQAGLGLRADFYGYYVGPATRKVFLQKIPAQEGTSNLAPSSNAAAHHPFCHTNGPTPPALVVRSL